MYCTVLYWIYGHVCEHVWGLVRLGLHAYVIRYKLKRKKKKTMISCMHIGELHYA